MSIGSIGVAAATGVSFLVCQQELCGLSTCTAQYYCASSGVAYASCLASGFSLVIFALVVCSGRILCHRLADSFHGGCSQNTLMNRWKQLASSSCRVVKPPSVCDLPVQLDFLPVLRCTACSATNGADPCKGFFTVSFTTRKVSGNILHPFTVQLSTHLFAVHQFQSTLAITNVSAFMRSTAADLINQWQSLCHNGHE